MYNVLDSDLAEMGPAQYAGTLLSPAIPRPATVAENVMDRSLFLRVPRRRLTATPHMNREGLIVSVFDEKHPVNAAGRAPLIEILATLYEDSIGAFQCLGGAASRCKPVLDKVVSLTNAGEGLLVVANVHRGQDSSEFAGFCSCIRADEEFKRTYFDVQGSMVAKRSERYEPFGEVSSVDAALEALRKFSGLKYDAPIYVASHAGLLGCYQGARLANRANGESASLYREIFVRMRLEFIQRRVNATESPAVAIVRTPNPKVACSFLEEGFVPLFFDAHCRQSGFRDGVLLSFYGKVLFPDAGKQAKSDAHTGYAVELSCL